MVITFILNKYIENNGQMIRRHVQKAKDNETRLRTNRNPPRTFQWAADLDNKGKTCIV